MKLKVLPQESKKLPPQTVPRSAWFIPEETVAWSSHGVQNDVPAGSIRIRNAFVDFPVERLDKGADL
jgi:hypothetical protein